MSHDTAAAQAASSREPEEVGQASGSAHAPVWNVFRRRDDKDLWCAVPCDHAVPSFLFSGAWTFGGIEGRRSRFANLAVPEARMAVQLNGFYLFMSFSHHSGLTS